MIDPVTIGIGLWLWNLSKGQKTADRLEYSPKNLEIINKKLVYKMDILNPTKNKLKVDSFFGGIFADDAKIGTVEKGDPFMLEPNKRTTVSFPVKLNAIGLLKFATNIKKLKEMKFKVAGIAHALGMDNPVSQDLSLNA
jgi:LEA14-like dessication related protein